jgi:4-hydroxy-3-methylbut-2-en-1-yl diphosphate synthase IspG/GcpE
VHPWSLVAAAGCVVAGTGEAYDAPHAEAVAAEKEATVLYVIYIYIYIYIYIS